MDEKTESLEFPINQELLASATQLKEQWKVIKDRLEKIEEHKEKVSPPVYQRVRSDYEKKLKEITDTVLEKKRTIDRELVTLYETQKRIAAQLETHRHTLEEIKFRNVLGEFSEEEYQRKAKDEQDKINKFETILSAVNTNISRYEDLFHEEIEVLPSEEEPQEKEAASEEAIPASEEFYEGLGGADYFTTGEVTTPGEEAPEIFITEKTKPGRHAASEKTRVVIISGDDAGATYPIKESVSFGRAESNTVVLRDAKVSRQHAKIVKQGEEYVLVDLNSSNGTFVNGERIEEHVLANNDEFQIGDTVLQFQA
jgi:hypothetical protein